MEKKWCDLDVFYFLRSNLLYKFQENLQILRDLSLLQVQMRDLEGYRVCLLRILMVYFNPLRTRVPNRFET